ncbi:DUF3375 domain-containing protein [Microbacterium gorillae]|uniref:DUF3375 domain-containing protein n=1 Tax=Microbacterium gorillae TaxID=1231063 RepID=UPI0005913D7F|nr:DUF3375 domain-containing protein [Microbacterium gorillae]
MPPTRAEAAYQRSAAAFRNPMLDLLHGRYAPFVVAVLSVVFTPDRPAVAVADAHAEIGEALEELRSTDAADRHLPSGTAREICRYWVRVGWLAPQIEGDVETYRLTAHAVGALEIAGRAGGGRARVSRSRVRTLLEAVDRLARDSATDPEHRIALLHEERDALDAEIARLEADEAEPVEDEQLLEEAENVLHLGRELPADFARVAESITAMQRDVVAELRRDVRPTGDVLREYLERGRHVMQSTPEGRAFQGALRLIGDPDQIERLATHLQSVLTQPFSRLLDTAQRSDLDAIGRHVEQGVQKVLTAQRRASQVITAQVRTHDPVRDRQIDDLLRSVMSGMQTLMQHGGATERVDPVHTFAVADTGHLRQTLHDLRPVAEPAPLTEADEVEFTDDDSRAWGGPHYPELERYVATLGDRFDLAAAFAGADEDTRRPVDLLGLLEIAHRNGMSEGAEVSIAEARRPDGTSRRFAFGAVTARTTKEPEDD